MIRDLKVIAEKHPKYPRLLFFYQGSVDEGDAFFNKLWAEARAASDEKKVFYNAFGIRRGGMKEMFGAEVWACGVRATLKGNMVGKATGDPWVMPGMFLVRGNHMLWQHDFRHAGDHPNFLAVLDQLPQDILTTFE